MQRQYLRSRGLFLVLAYETAQHSGIFAAHRRLVVSAPHTDLLETIAEEIVANCLADERVAACRVSVMKLDIFNEAESAGIEVFRTRKRWAG